MSDDILSALPIHKGHFRLESGYHSDLWFTLDALFCDPRGIAPLVSKLASLLAAYEPAAVCGPLLGGAFLAQAVAAELRAQFLYSQPLGNSESTKLFQVRYGLPPELQKRSRNQRVALVDDVISAGSSVRATAEALTASGASVVVVGALIFLGTKGMDHFAGLGVPVEMLGRRDFTSWPPSECPLCAARIPLQDTSNPTSGDQ